MDRKKKQETKPNLKITFRTKLSSISDYIEQAGREFILKANMEEEE